MIQQQLQSLAPAKDQARGLERLALFLKDISEAWKQADEQQHNRLAKQLFDIVWIKDKRVLAVTPRPEFKPFFRLSCECHAKDIGCDPEGIRTPDLHRDRVSCCIR
jgi:hypothetical protein